MGTMANLGYIKTATAFTCGNVDIPLTIQAAGNAAMLTLFQAASLGCTDIIKMRAGISPWHSRGMRALANGILTPAEHNLVSKVWKFIIPAEKALFFMWVVDLTTGFFANWQSQMFKLGACDTKADWASGNGSDPHWVCPAPGVFGGVSYATFEKSGPLQSHIAGFEFVVPEGYYFTCSFSVKPKPFIFQGPITFADCVLKEISPPPYSYTPQRSEPPWYGNNFTATSHWGGQNKRHSDKVFRLTATCDQIAFADGGSYSIMVSSVPLLNTGLIPVNCFGLPANANPDQQGNIFDGT
jgi:hypothetical protein